MFRMIGFGENLGSGFPLILNAWKEAGWGNPVLENKIELDEVELALPVKNETATETATETVNATVIEKTLLRIYGTTD